MPITPTPETPPVTLAHNAVDWTEQLDALTDKPGDWFKVDGPLKTTQVAGRRSSIVRFGEARGHTIETVCPKTGEDRWLYARLVVDQAEAAQPAPTPRPKAETRPLAAAPDPTPPTSDDDDTHPYHCDTCGDDFRTNTRLRQHQANAHKAS